MMWKRRRRGSSYVDEIDKIARIVRKSIHHQRCPAAKAFRQALRRFWREPLPAFRRKEKEASASGLYPV